MKYGAKIRDLAAWRHNGRFYDENFRFLRQSRPSSIQLNQEVKNDLDLDLKSLKDFNGKSFFLDDNWLSSSRLNLYKDVSGACGFVAVFDSHWCYGKWPDDWAYRNIAILEFYPIVFSL